MDSFHLCLEFDFSELDVNEIGHIWLLILLDKGVSRIRFWGAIVPLPPGYTLAVQIFDWILFRSHTWLSLFFVTVNQNFMEK